MDENSDWVLSTRVQPNGIFDQGTTKLCLVLSTVVRLIPYLVLSTSGAINARLIITFVQENVN